MIQLHPSFVQSKPDLQLGLGRLKRWQQKISDISSSFIEIEAHSLTAQSLGNNIELNAIDALVINLAVLSKGEPTCSH